MSSRSINDQCRALLWLVRRSITFLSDVDLGRRMKSLNDIQQYDKALHLIEKYNGHNLKQLSSMVITQALKACSRTGNLQYGSHVHHLVSSRLNNDPYIVSSLIHLYMQCGDVRTAESLFKQSTTKTLSIYGAMMKGYIEHQQAQKAIDLFTRIRNPNAVILILVFNACAQIQTSEALSLVKRASSHIPPSFYSNPNLSPSLLDALIKCGDCSSAQAVFRKMKKCVIDYGSLMSGLNKANRPKETLELFDQMKKDSIRPNSVVFLCVIKAVAQVGMCSLSEALVQQIPRSLLNDAIRTALIDMWGKTGFADRAREVFDKIDQPNQFHYGAMIHSYGLNGIGSSAIELFRQMPSELINEVTYICILDACSHSGLVDQARSIFSQIVIQTDKIYTAMIDCLSRAALFQEAQELIGVYEREYSPACSMYMALLSGARNANHNHLSGKTVVRMKQLFPELTDILALASTLLANVYGSSGDTDKASIIKHEMKRSGLTRKMGGSWTFVNEKLYQFQAHDRSHPRTSEIYAQFDRISKELIEHGHQYDPSWITRALKEGETIESALCEHSEKLATTTSRIQIAKNLRVCGDCHRATKLFAQIRQCDIIVRDTNRIHHFYRNGPCSCEDYF